MISEVPAAPGDADARRAVEPVIVYPNGTLAPPDLGLYRSARAGASKTGEVLVQPREGGCFHVPAGGFFRISSVEGPQVGDLNLWNAHNLDERFYSGKTRAIHGTHITTGERMWSNLPYLRPMATIIEDTLGWYGMDEFGGSIHDVIGSAPAAIHTHTIFWRAMITIIAAIRTCRARLPTRPAARSRRSRCRCMTCSTSSCAQASPATPASIS